MLTKYKNECKMLVIGILIWRQFKRPVNKYFWPVKIIFVRYGYWKKSILFPVDKTEVPVTYFDLAVFFFSSKYFIFSHLRLLF